MPQTSKGLGCGKRLLKSLRGRLGARPLAVPEGEKEPLIPASARAREVGAGGRALAILSCIVERPPRGAPSRSCLSRLQQPLPGRAARASPPLPRVARAATPRARPRRRRARRRSSATTQRRLHATAARWRSASRAGATASSPRPPRARRRASPRRGQRRDPRRRHRRRRPRRARACATRLSAAAAAIRSGRARRRGRLPSPGCGRAGSAPAPPPRRCPGCRPSPPRAGSGARLRGPEVGDSAWPDLEPGQRGHPRPLVVGLAARAAGQDLARRPPRAPP